MRRIASIRRASIGLQLRQARLRLPVLAVVAGLFQFELEPELFLGEIPRQVLRGLDPRPSTGGTASAFGLTVDIGDLGAAAAPFSARDGTGVST